MKHLDSPFVLVIFGATGDLTKKKLMPALYKLLSEGFLPEKFSIIGVGRRDMDDTAFRNYLHEAIVKSSSSYHLNEGAWRFLAQNITYQKGLFEDQALYTALSKRLDSFDSANKTPVKRYFYLATPPDNYAQIIEQLHSSKIARSTDKTGENFARILVEKPFGKDAQHARSLETLLSKAFEEKQIYRIDHYLGKEAIQNIIAFRFANGIFEPIWNKDYIDHVQITMTETGGVSGRIGFYEGVGAMRDVMQNHMLSMLSLVAMEQPQSFSAAAVRDSRMHAMRSIQSLDPKYVESQVVRGQYVKVSTKDPQEHTNEYVGYREEEKVDPNSMTETYVAMKVFLDTSRWAGVPWYLRTGKRLHKDVAEISIVFKQSCHVLFKEVGCPEDGNILTLRVSPNEGIGVRFIIKKPGHEFKLKSVDMKFHYRESFSDDEVTDAYENVLEEVFKGDQMLFNRSDEMEQAWRIIHPIMKNWELNKGKSLYFYTSGTWGPKEADDLLEKDGKHWVLR